jgi:ornithine cyclodeaminase/alanine dehydrogenase-like protein (mu-crystallin family)
MLIVSESEARTLVAMPDAIEAVAGTFAALDRSEAASYPVVREKLGTHAAVFGVKTGYDRAAGALGLKAGGYWPHNAARGLTNHQSTTLLFDAETGRAAALVGANYLTGVRTGAAAALATRHLARADARVLGIVGTGTQALYQLDAIRCVRPLDEVVAWNRTPARLEAFLEAVRARGLAARAASLEETCRTADILVTATPGLEPLVAPQWIRPGTHINAVGADTAGKQELEPALVARAAVYVDSLEQAITIGECQHAVRLGLFAPSRVRGTLGGLVSGRLPGRANAADITLFDSTGIALQDLAVAALAVQRAGERGCGTAVEFG